MSGFDFTSIMGTLGKDVELPPLLPMGTYDFRINKVSFPDNRGTSVWHRTVFSVSPIQAHEDVDEELLAEHTAELADGQLSNSVMERAFMFNEEDPHQQKTQLVALANFLSEHCGLEQGDDEPIQEVIDRSTGAMFSGSVGWDPDKQNPEIMRAQIKKTAPVD